MYQSLMLSVFQFLKFKILAGYVVVPRYGFDLYFPGD